MKNIKINSEFFELPANKFINKLMLSKFSFEPIELFDNTPSIFISPNVSRIDKQLVNRCITTKFIFIKDEVINKINHNELANENKTKLLNEIKFLAENGYSFSLFFNNSPTVFGDNQPISETLSQFLFETELDLKFLTFPGLFFAFPVWADEPRKTKIYSNQNVTIKHRRLVGFNKKEIAKTISNATPSTASIYNSKQPVQLHSNKLACHLERVMYCCPNCESLFSLYSEFSCIKCKNCGTAIEFSPEGNILFSQKLTCFDDIEKYQFKTLTKKDMHINELISYDEITQISSKKCKKTTKNDIILQIYAEKLIFINKNSQLKTEILFEDVDYVNYHENNILEIKTKNAKNFYFCGNNNENLLIIKDLVKLNKN